MHFLNILQDFNRFTKSQPCHNDLAIFPKIQSVITTSLLKYSWELLYFIRKDILQIFASDKSAAFGIQRNLIPRSTRH